MKEKELKDKELDVVNGGFIPRSYDAESKEPGIDPAVIKLENEKKTEKDTFIPIP